MRIQAFEITDPETVHPRLALQNGIHLLKQRRQPECGHPKDLENIRLFDHPHLVSAPVTPPMASAGINKPLPSGLIITAATNAKMIDLDGVDCLMTTLHFASQQNVDGRDLHCRDMGWCVFHGDGWLYSRNSNATPS